MVCDKCPYRLECREPPSDWVKCWFLNSEVFQLRYLIDTCGKAANKKGFKVKWNGEAKKAFPTFVTLTAHELLDAVDKGWRNDDKEKAFEEIGDCFVRLFHICYDLEIPLEKILLKIMEENKKRAYKHGKKII